MNTPRRRLHAEIFDEIPPHYRDAMAQSDDQGEQKSHEQLQVDATVLRGLAHPLRGRLLDQLQYQGPATATILGERLGESSGSASYHLRQLSRYGFIEAVPGKSGGRERWWRIRPGGWRMRGHAFRENPETRSAAEAVLDRHYRGRRERFESWTALLAEVPNDPQVSRWKDVATDSNTTVRMTPEEASALAEAMADFLHTWLRENVPEERTEDSAPEAEAVELQTTLFPVLSRVFDPQGVEREATADPSKTDSEPFSPDEAV